MTTEGKRPSLRGAINARSAGRASTIRTVAALRLVIELHKAYLAAFSEAGGQEDA